MPGRGRSDNCHDLDDLFLVFYYHQSVKKTSNISYNTLAFITMGTYQLLFNLLYLS